MRYMDIGLEVEAVGSVRKKYMSVKNNTDFHVAIKYRLYVLIYKKNLELILNSVADKQSL